MSRRPALCALAVAAGCAPAAMPVALPTSTLATTPVTVTFDSLPVGTIGTTGACAANDPMPVHRPADPGSMPNPMRGRQGGRIPNACPVRDASPPSIVVPATAGTAYHLGQLVLVRPLRDAWPPE